MGEVPGAAAVLGAAVLAEGGRRAGGGGAGEAVGEAVVGDAGEAVVGVVGVVGESGVGTRGGGVAHRGRLLELDIDTASRGVFDGLLGLVVEVIVPQAVAGRSQGVRRALEHARPTRPTGGRGRGGRWRAALRGCGETGKGSVCVCAFASECGKVSAGQAKDRVFGKERVRFLTRKGTQKCSLLCQWALTEKRTLWFERGRPT